MARLRSILQPAEEGRFLNNPSTYYVRLFSFARCRRRPSGRNLMQILIGGEEGRAIRGDFRGILSKITRYNIPRYNCAYAKITFAELKTVMLTVVKVKVKLTLSISDQILKRPPVTFSKFKPSTLTGNSFCFVYCNRYRQMWRSYGICWTTPAP